MADGRRPLASGFFFSFGHSTVIVGVGVGITVAARAVFGAVVNPSSTYETAGGAAGTAMSAGFLYLIALLNLIVLSGIVKVFREMRRGTYDEDELEAQLQARGLMYRFFGRFMRSINHTWQLYFVGLIFGIGFDTATEVVLLAATAYAAIQGLPYYAVLAVPALFSGGMMLFDTLDGCFMNFAYGWAFARPVRTVYYNLVITALSIGAAFIVGTIELLGVLTTEIHLHGPFWDAVANFNINVAGFCIAGLFVLVWATALAYWRWGNVEDRWSSGLRSSRKNTRRGEGGGWRHDDRHRGPVGCSSEPPPSPLRASILRPLLGPVAPGHRRPPPVSGAAGTPASQRARLGARSEPD
jgi:high-affinity nickel-transport protein